MTRVSVFIVSMLAIAVAAGASPAAAQSGDTPPAQPEATGPAPFGATLFGGHFSAQREDGIHADYRVLPGDRVLVNVWGSVTINEALTVDTQGNIFLPGVGPVHVGGVRNGDLTRTVRDGMRRVYRGSFEVYTNLMSASPVAVFVTGGVTRPGRYAGVSSDSVLYYLDQAGGIEANHGSYRQVRIIRGGQPVAELDLYDFLLRGTLPTHQFADGDVVLVGQRGPVVEVHGLGTEVTAVELARGDETGADLLGILPQSARATRVQWRAVRDGTPRVRDLDVGTFGDTALGDGDVVRFFATGRPGHIVVRVEGEYDGPSPYLTVRRGSRLVDVLQHLPVDPELANYQAIHIKRREVAEQQRQSIHQALDRLERSAMLALSDSSGEAEIRVREAELMRAFVERARAVQPLGRVVTTSAGRQMNVVLQENDVIVIPTRTNVVRIGGEVQINQAVMYRPELTARDYIRMAGGLTNRGESRAVIVLRQSAEVEVGRLSTPIRPGDEILVPPRIDNKAFQHAMDLSSIVYQIAIAASVLLRV